MQELQSHNLKEIAARYAVNHLIQPGMNIGLGTGTTAAFAVKALAERIQTEGFEVGRLIGTSIETIALARFYGMTTEDDLTAEMGWLDVTIDGADEVNRDLTVIKGGGGALLREKLVASRTRREVIIVNESKVVETMGQVHPLPVMIVPFGFETTIERINSLTGRSGRIRKTAIDDIFVSDDGLYCYDIAPAPIENPAEFASALNSITGVVDNGLFIGLCQTAVIAQTGGNIEVWDKSGE